MSESLVPALTRIVLIVSTALAMSSAVAAQGQSPGRDRSRLRVGQTKIAMTLDRATYAPGEEVTVSITVQNIGATPIEVQDPTHFEYAPLRLSRVVLDAGGQEAEYMLSPQPPSPNSAPPSLVLAAGEERTAQTTFTAPYEDGTYDLLFMYPYRPRTRFVVRSPKIMEIVELKRSKLMGEARRLVPAMARGLVVKESEGQMSILLSTQPGDVADRHQLKPGDLMMGGDYGFRSLRRIVPDREAISNLRLSEDPANHAQLLVQFEEGGKPAKTMRFNAKYELLEAQ